MKNLIYLLLILLFLPNCTPKQSAYTSPTTTNLGGIKGVVVDKSSKALGNISIFLYQNSRVVKKTITDNNGVFKFDIVTTGIYDLKAAHAEYETYSKNKIIVKSNKVIFLKKIKLKEREIKQLLKPERPENLYQRKPIIYFYPTESIEVNVQLDYDGELIHTYPKYSKNGWTIQAETDGTLTDKLGKKYYALYWEGKTDYQFNLDEGFVVEGDKTIDFLEDALEKLGLNRREANEFIIYWLPILEQNPYNLIHFSTTEYHEMARLNITPKPETLIRIMMLFKPLDTPISIEKQDISALKKERKGFTVVEWGGQELPANYPLR